MATGDNRDWLRTPPGGTDSWPGWVSLTDPLWLWGRDLGAWWFLVFSDAHLAVRLFADSQGLYLSPRGWWANRALRRETTFVPWTDVAGCRERSIGFHSAGGRAYSFVRLHRVTIDLVGGSADGHVPEPTPKELRKLLKQAGIDPDLPLGAGEEGEEEPLTPQEIAEDEALDREFYGPDWRPGTMPLVFTTRRPQPILDAVNGRHRGRVEKR